ncbi:MAG: J domain-containing protein [Candidatus Aminicenantales bacterium]
MNHIGLFLRKIYFHKLSGVLLFKRDSVQKQLHFREGDLVQAKTNVTEERLGEIMFKLGKISAKAHSQLERYIKPGQAIGKILSQKGLTSKRNVDEGLAYQIKEIALSLFPHFDAEIVFQEKPAVEGQDVVSRINVPYLIEDGVRRMGFHPALQRHLEKKAPYPKNKIFLQLLTEEEKEMLDKIKGGNASDLILRSLKYNPEFFWKSLYLFYCLNLIDFRDQDQLHTEEAGDKDDEAAQAHSQEQLEEVLAFKEKLQTSNYYQILGLAKEASEENIKKAYFLLARKFHPDRFDRSLSPQHRVLVEDVFDRITKAYRTLSSQELRKAYDLKAPVAGAGESGRDVLKKADHKFRQAKTLYSLGRYEDSICLLEEVTRLNKIKGAYFLLLALSETKIPSMRRKAEADFLKAIELEPWNPECYVGLGVLYRQEGMTLKATKLFQKALEYDDDHEIARKELDALRGTEKKTGLKGLFSNILFGTKKK